MWPRHSPHLCRFAVFSVQTNVSLTLGSNNGNIANENFASLSSIPSVDLPVGLAFCVSLLMIQAAWTAEMNWHSGLRGMGAEFFIKASNSMRGVYLDAQLTPSWQRPTQHRLLSDICGAKCVGVVSARLRLAKSHSSVVAKGWASSEPEGTKKATTSCAREFPHHSQ